MPDSRVTPADARREIARIREALAEDPARNAALRMLLDDAPEDDAPVPGMVDPVTGLPEQPDAGD